MKYHSTRGQAPVLDFADVVLTGLARDGGLYVPETYPHFSKEDWRGLRDKPYSDIAFAVMKPYIGDTLSDMVLKQIIQDTYAGFHHSAIAPLTQLGHYHFLLELFHGPTLAFKDYALQLLGKLFDHFLHERNQRLTILGATSGDTGSAAIEACRDRDTLDIFILHPLDRTSEIQRKQMTTVLANNVHNIALKAPFDDCQTIVKKLFGDLEFRDRYRLAAVNSINWARILGQVVYYAYAALNLGAPDRSVSFSVPTGNFGNVFAAYVAKRMGLPIVKLMVATNKNDILARFFASGVMETAAVSPSIAPSMDIQISSNFERLLHDSVGCNPQRVVQTMAEFTQTGAFKVEADALAYMRETFMAGRVEDARITATIRHVFKTTGELIDPHTAVGVTPEIVQTLPKESAIVSLACAHPAKFPEAVKEAAGLTPALPSFLADLFQKEERMVVLENDLTTVKTFVEQTLRAQKS